MNILKGFKPIQDLQSRAETAGTSVRTYMNSIRMNLMISWYLTMESVGDFLRNLFRQKKVGSR